MIHHHLAHAADSFYSSPFDEAAVLTLDGSGSTPHGYYGGIFYYGKGDKLFPLHPHNLLIGQTYLRTAVMLGLGANGSGKLMGLAPYGEPLFHEDEFVGNWPDISNALSLFVPLFTSTAIMELTKVWQYRFTLLARQRSMDVSVLGDADRVTDPFPAAVAASMQSIFQTTILRALEAFLELLERNGVGTSNLAFGGGSALNVVTNQAIPRSTAFRNVSVGPTVDDSGLAIGAAYALAHCILNEPRAAISDAPSISTRAYQGRKFDESMIRDAAGEFGDTISIEKPSDFIERAADDVVEGRIIGWFEGRSEIGPRALGHRSLVADPTRKDAWPRMNRLKGREMWRPLAPSVLVERVDEFFGDMPAHSPFMTFNSTVLTDRLPAITHVDGTARVQTVRPEVGGYYSLIKAVGDRNGVPVVMNTSFNGPEEPIVDTPTDAIRFLVNTDLDALYIEGLRVTRAES